MRVIDLHFEAAHVKRRNMRPAPRSEFRPHLPTFDECRLSAVCDADETLLSRFAVDLPDVQRFTRFDDLIDTRPDICVIASPVALQAGCHVLQEVFLAETLEQCRQLYEAVKAHPKQKFMLAENCCYWHFILEWKKMWQTGQLGIDTRRSREHDVRSLMMTNSRPTWRTALPPIHYLTHSLGPAVDSGRVNRAIAAPPACSPGTTTTTARWPFRPKKAPRSRCSPYSALSANPLSLLPLYGTHGCLESQRLMRYAPMFLSAQNALRYAVAARCTDPQVPDADSGGHGMALWYAISYTAFAAAALRPSASMQR